MWIAVAIVVVSIFFMLLFQKNIRKLIDRIKSGKAGKYQFQTNSPTQNSSGLQAGSAEKLVGGVEPHNLGDSPEDRLMDALNSPAIKEIEKSIKEILIKAGVEEGPKKEKLLLRYLAATELAFHFQRIEHTIWGSQIYILEYLNDNRNGALQDKIKQSFYDDAVKKWPSFFTNYPYEHYIGYLIAERLLVENNGHVCITTFGVEFLQYLVRAGKSGARFREG